MNRTAYHRAYYERTKDTRRKIARERRRARYWAVWLIRELRPDAFADCWVSALDLRSSL